MRRKSQEDFEYKVQTLLNQKGKNGASSAEVSLFLGVDLAEADRTLRKLYTYGLVKQQADKWYGRWYA